jgi:hypothetical protein
MVLPTHWRSYMLRQKQDFSYRHTYTCALTFHASFPHTGQRRPNKALGIRLVPWFLTMLSLLNSLYQSIASSLTQDHGAGTKKIPWIHWCDATYCLCLLQVGNFTHEVSWGLSPLFTPRPNINLLYSLGLLHTTLIFTQVQILVLAILQGPCWAQAHV